MICLRFVYFHDAFGLKARLRGVSNQQTMLSSVIKEKLMVLRGIMCSLVKLVKPQASNGLYKSQ